MAAGGSSIIEFAGAAPRRPKTCPNATRNACAFRSHSPANFEFPRPCRRPRRGAHHEHQRDPRDAAEEGRRQWLASLKRLRLYGFAKLRRSVAAPTEGLLCWSTHALEACKDFLSKAVSAACFFVFAPCCEALLPGSGFLGCGLLGSRVLGL